MGVYFGDDFAVEVTRQRQGADEVSFRAIFGVADLDALQGYALNAEAMLRWPEGPDVRADDRLTIDGRTFVVLETPRRVVDGRELEALLGSA